MVIIYFAIILDILYFVYNYTFVPRDLTCTGKEKLNRNKKEGVAPTQYPDTTTYGHGNIIFQCRHATGAAWHSSLPVIRNEDTISKHGAIVTVSHGGGPP